MESKPPKKPKPKRAPGKSPNASPKAGAGQVSSQSPQLREQLCDRFMLACEATLLSKSQFAVRVGLTPQQLTNISNYRNPPSHEAIERAVREFGLTANWFYSGDRVGIRDAELAERLRTVENGERV